MRYLTISSTAVVASAVVVVGPGLCCVAFRSCKGISSDLCGDKCVYVLGHFSCIQLFATLWTIACQTPLSMEFSRQEYWSRLPFPPPGDRPDPGIEFGSSALQADPLPIEPLEKPPTLGRGWQLFYLKSCHQVWLPRWR